MEVLSKEYGWTPNQIRQTSLVDIRAYLEIISMKNKIKEREQRKHKR